MGDLILQHGQAVLFIVSLIAQLGAPVPMTPLLLAAGALAKVGQLSLASVVASSMAASALGHLVWYEAGRRRGTAVLRLICRISLEPDSCVRRTEDFFGRHGGRALVAAPFVPGLGAVAPPLAGMAGMPVARFLLLDSLGALLWSALLAGVGFVAGPELMALVRSGLEFVHCSGLLGVVGSARWWGGRFPRGGRLHGAGGYPPMGATALASRPGSTA